MSVATDEPIPGGLQLWLDANSTAVSNLKNKKQKGSGGINRGWAAFLPGVEANNSAVLYKKDDPIGPGDDPDDPGGGTCEDEIITVTPLLETNWGQDEGYNNDAPDYNCPYTTNSRALTGCVATAIAQVMRYHEYPATYNWNIKPDDNITQWNQPYGTEEIAQLMRDVGDGVNMQWGCASSGGSGAYTEDGEGALENIFTYSASVDYKSYDWDKIQWELDQNRPVILDGYTDDGAGHAWVVDGYTKDINYFTDCSGYISTLYFHMNWGWEGEHNGYFAFDNFNPGSSYNVNNHQLHGIQP